MSKEPGALQLILHLHENARKYLEIGLSVNRFTSEFLQGQRLIRSLDRAKYSIDLVNQKIGESIKIIRHGTLLGALVGPILEVTTILGLAVIVVIGYLLYRNFGIEILPQLFAFLVVINRALPKLTAMNRSRAVVVDSIPTVNRLSEFLEGAVLETEETGTRPFPTLKEDIHVENVSVRYLEGEPKALDGINLTIPAGKFTAIVGENGAGKSTFFDLLVRLHTPDEGSIIIDGVDSRDIDLDSWRENIGIVSQEPFLFHASIWENIAFGRPDASREEIFEAARMARIVDFAESMADGYDTIVGNRGTRLSGGQRMRVAIATAFLRKPRLLLLDEITSSLDSESEHEVMKAVEALKGDSTIIAISHRLSSVRSADNIFVLKSGKLVEQGTHEELISKNGLYARYWQIQHREKREAA